MIVSKNKIRIISVTIFAFIAGFISTTKGGEPLIPPEIVDMKIIGAMGDYTNSITSNLLLNGNYLYCSMIWGGGLKTLDVSDPTNMVLTSEWTDGGGGSGQAYGLGMKGTVLYMANWAPNIGLRVFNISDPAHPSLITTRNTTVHAWKLYIEGNLLFISVSNGYDVAGIDIFNISNPSNPAFLTFVSSPHRLVGRPAAYGNYMYMISNNWMKVYNISNPSSPTVIRQLNFNARTGTGDLEIKDGYLYMRADDDTYPDPDWLDGGVYVFSITDPSNPQQVEFFEREMGKDLYLQERYCIIPAGGNGVYGLDISDPLDITLLWHIALSWPGTGPGGYPNGAAGAGDYIFIGTVQSNGCTQCGGRVYALHIEEPKPPIIAEVTPDPDSVYIGYEYSKQLTLLQGTPLPTWSVVQAPAGTQVDNNGLVSGWTPASADVGSMFAFNIKATNEDGQDIEHWQVRVKSRADFDGDYDVDQEDFGKFQACYTGPGVFPTPECEVADFDTDRDVDIDDFTVFNNCLGGPNNTPGC